MYRVFVAPGPSFIADARTNNNDNNNNTMEDDNSNKKSNVELPFVGTSFSYIVTSSGSEPPFPSITANDVGTVDVVGSGGSGTGRTYVIVLNAVDTIHILEVGWMWLDCEGGGEGGGEQGGY